jgi:hypothetical protein
MWRIVPQIEKVRKQEVSVLCKQVRFTPPITDATGELKFFRLKFPVYKVIIEHDSGVCHTITWSHKGDSTVHGKFIYCWGGKEKTEWVVAEKFWEWMRANRADIAEEMKVAMDAKMGLSAA